MKKNKSHVDYIMNLFSNIMSRHPELQPGCKPTPAKIIAIAHQTMDQIHGGRNLRNGYFLNDRPYIRGLYKPLRKVRTYADLCFDDSVAKLLQQSYQNKERRKRNENETKTVIIRKFRKRCKTVRAFSR